MAQTSAEKITFVSGKERFEAMTARKCSSATSPLTVIMGNLPKKAYSHSIHTAVVARILAGGVKELPEDMDRDIFTRSVWQGGFCHHIGMCIISNKDKTQIPAATEQLLKEKLEYDYFLDRDIVLQIARYHGERIDGSGYPDGLCGNQIPLAARLVGFACKLDELITRRSGNTAQNVVKAARFMQKNGAALFGGDVMNCFEQAQTEIFDLYLDRSMRISG